MSREPLISVEQALDRILEGVTPLSVEEVPVTEAHGRILAEPLVSRRTQPPADVSSMDGYAVRSQDLVVGGKLRRIGESGAGRPYKGTLKAGETIRIFTGAI